MSREDAAQTGEEGMEKRAVVLTEQEKTAHEKAQRTPPPQADAPAPKKGGPPAGGS